MFSVCLIPGDGIGQEVIPAAAEVLAALGLGIRFTQVEAGFELFRRTGEALPEKALAEVHSTRLALFGATSSPSTYVEAYRSPILAMRRTFDLYANLRPVSSLPGSFSGPDLDLLIVRENSEGLYAGQERITEEGTIAERVITERASRRIARVAFEQAERRRIQGRGCNLTVVHKANVLKLSDGLFRRCCLETAREFPHIMAREMLVDAMAMRLVRDAHTFDVLVTTNLFGDILSDEASALVGGLGVAPSANLGPEVAVFEPVHGSAPDIAGQGIANPIGAILSAAMLLDHAGQAAAAGRVRAAVNAALHAGISTRDLGGRATTHQMTREVIRNL